VLVAVVIFGRVVLRLPGVPYNVKELTGDHPTLALIMLGLTLLACGGLPMAFASLSRRQPFLFAKLFGPLAAGVASAVFLILWLIVPMESIDDVVGSPVLAIGRTLERWLRFVGLCAGPLAGVTLGARFVLGDLRAKPFFIGIAVATAVMLTSYVIVVPLAATNNIAELLRNKGGAAAACGAAGYFMLTGAVFALLARSLAPSSGRFAWFVPFLVLVLSIPIAWQFFVLTTNPRLEKYGHVFSARQFLLSPDREHYLDDREIFLRFAMLQAGLTCVLASGAVAVFPGWVQRTAFPIAP
jgi:hypothetical protein